MTLYNCTKTFCIAFFDNLQENLFQMLSPDCRIQNKYGSARGINGIENCIKKLHDIHTILSELASSKTNMDINVISSTQTCILITNDGSEQSLIGIGLEWECNIITGIVCMQYIGTVDPDIFIELMYYNELEDEISNGNKYVQGIILNLDEVKEYNSNLTSMDGSYNTLSSIKSKEIKERLPLDINLILEGQYFYHIHTISKKEENQLIINKHLNILRPDPPSEVERKGILLKSKLNRKNKKLGKKTVHFTTIANVILIEKLIHQQDSKRAPIPLSNVHYTSQDYRRFNCDREEELRIEMDLKNISRDDAELSLYQEEGLLTDHNIIITSTELETRGDGDKAITDDIDREDISFDRISMSRRSSMSRESLGRDSTGPRDLSIITRERSKSMDDDVDRDLILKKHLEHEVQLAEAKKLKENAKNTWYPGKYVSILRGGGGESPKVLEDNSRESITFISTQKNNANRNTKDIKYIHKKITKNAGYILRRILIPPKRVRPVIIHITVVCCNNLLTPIWPLSIDSYVEMNVDGEKQFTEISYGHKNPIYALSEVYTFALTLENTYDNYIYFTVWDKRNVGQDTALGITRCSFAALKCQKDNKTPVSVILPLLDNVNEDVLGNGFCNSSNYYQHISTKSTRKELTHKEKNKTKPTISLLISKVDVDSYEILNKLKIEDDEREKSEVNKSWV